MLGGDLIGKMQRRVDVGNFNEILADEPVADLNLFGLPNPPDRERMFALVDITPSGMTDTDYAFDLLDKTGVATMPGASFGPGLTGWVRLSLTLDDAAFDTALDRIVDHAAGLT